MRTKKFLQITGTLLVALCFNSALIAQPYPNPYANVESWANLPGGRTMGAVGDVDVDADGVHMWAVIRCDATAQDRFGNECVDSSLDPIIKFDAEGNVVESFGGDMFIWPHGIEIDSDGNVWVTDAVSDARIPDGDKRGHQVIKFSPTGEVLMVLGTPGESGTSNRHFNSPADVVIGNNGDIFVADGHNNGGNNRVMKFNSEGEFLMSWGQTGYGPSEFRALHTIAIDNRGRLFIGDRSNNRLQLFEQDGTFISQWTQYGRPSGIFFDQHDNIFVADSESDNVQNPGWDMGIRVGDANEGWVKYFVQLPTGDERFTIGNGAEFVAVDAEGNMFGGEPAPRKLQKYVRVRR